MCDTPLPMLIAFNRRVNLKWSRLAKEGKATDAVLPQSAINVPHDMLVLYPRSLQQEYGLTHFGTYLPDLPRNRVTTEQETLIDHMIDYVFKNELLCLFGMNGQRFFVAVDSKHHAMMLKLSI